PDNPPPRRTAASAAATSGAGGRRGRANPASGEQTDGSDRPGPELPAAPGAAAQPGPASATAGIAASPSSSKKEYHLVLTLQRKDRGVTGQDNLVHREALDRPDIAQPERQGDRGPEGELEPDADPFAARPELDIEQRAVTAQATQGHGSPAFGQPGGQL